MLRTLKRALRHLGLGLALLTIGALAWALFWALYNPTVKLAPPLLIRRPPTGRSELTLMLGGDFAPTDAAMTRVRREGYRQLYRPTAHLFRDADLALVNLEAPITTSTEPFLLWRKYLYRVEPAALPAFSWLGLDVVSLANNHLLDYRDRGALDTFANLSRAKIAKVGAGATEAEARRPLIVDMGGTRIGILAYLEHTAAFNLYIRAYAIGDRVGAAQLNEADLIEDIHRLRPIVDVLIVSVHWGKNYQPITATQERYAQKMADLGVDLVVGHHPHDVQAAELRGKTLVLYSLGNYAWGTPGWDTLRMGFLARVFVHAKTTRHGAKITAVELLPIVTQNRIVNFQPRLLAPNEARWLEPFLKETRRRKTTFRIYDQTIRIERWAKKSAMSPPSPSTPAAAREEGNDHP